ncbi:glycosyltransferase [Pedobacter gandavensis]|uniref:Glycosyltransferase n=1 Tax=Pedobacter gandavensis TaxID=2679963 RepID=A0ABR6ET18_9SPHI|nr:glycosyltransferase [Pedobacter gandavensis]MBB2148403.1 glycosyltransferase [Pedobacter gandavensis]
MDDWGGSEELWAKSIPMLKKGTSVLLFKNRINSSHPEFIKLIQQQVKLVELEPHVTIPEQFNRKIKQLYKRLRSRDYRQNYGLDRFHDQLKEAQPDLVIVAQGINFDGLIYAYQCHLLKIPYVIIAQKAVDFYWPYPTDRDYMKKTLLHAKQCFFVSHHNKTLTEEQFGLRLENSQVVFNPIKTKVNVLPHPETSQGYKLACVARLFIIDKAQDILLRIMNKKKWRERPITLSLIGTGLDEQGIKDMANLLALDNVEFLGFHDDIENLWRNYHALLLPSRSEGLPLSMIEAMSVGRTVIVSNAGGNADIINDGVNGFIAEATEKDFEAAMERAWQLRDRWPEIGTAASLHITNHLPISPETDFANHLNDLLDEL